MHVQITWRNKGWTLTDKGEGRAERKGTEQENDPGEGEAVIEEGLIFWEDVAPLSIWVNSLKSGSAVKPHYRTEQKHVGASQMLQGHQAHRQGQRLKEKKKKQMQISPESQRNWRETWLGWVNGQKKELKR